MMQIFWKGNEEHVRRPQKAWLALQIQVCKHLPGCQAIPTVSKPRKSQSLDLMWHEQGEFCFHSYSLFRSIAVR